MIKIEKGIPAPKPGNLKYPWPDMEVGDSFVSEATAQSLLSAGVKYSRRHKLGFKFTTVKEGKTTRIWRVK